MISLLCSKRNSIIIYASILTNTILLRIIVFNCTHVFYYFLQFTLKVTHSPTREDSLMLITAISLQVYTIMAAVLMTATGKPLQEYLMRTLEKFVLGVSLTLNGNGNQHCDY